MGDYGEASLIIELVLDICLIFFRMNIAIENIHWLLLIAN